MSMYDIRMRYETLLRFPVISVGRKKQQRYVSNTQPTHCLTDYASSMVRVLFKQTMQKLHFSIQSVNFYMCTALRPFQKNLHITNFFSTLTRQVLKIEWKSSKLKLHGCKCVRLLFFNTF